MPVDEQHLRRALDRAHRFLAPRDRTVVEMTRHLERAEDDPAVVDAALAELAAGGLLDDTRLAHRFTEDRRNLDGWGTERIRARLLEMGVPADIAQRAVGDRGTEEELDAAVALLRRRLRGAPTDEQGRQRALGLLVRRGYELELAYDAVRRFEREEDGRPA